MAVQLSRLSDVIGYRRGFSSAESHDVVDVRIRLQGIDLGDGVIGHADDLMHIETGRARHPREFGGLDEFCVVGLARAFKRHGITPLIDPLNACEIGRAHV